MQKRLIQLGAWLFATLIGGAFLTPILSTRPPDFMPFYLGGKLASAGRISQIYHKPAYQPLINELRSTGERMHPVDAHYFIRPAFQAFFYIPFTWFSYPTASWLSILGNFVILGVLVWKLPIWFAAPPGARVWLAAFLPFLWSIGIGQDTLLLTLLVAGSLCLARDGRKLLAGLLLGLCAYKPHLIWAMPLALMAAGQWKMTCSFLATGLALGLASFAAVGTKGLQEWIQLVQAPSSDLMPETMGNLRALGLHFGSVAFLVAAALTVICFAIILCRGTFHEKFSAAVFTALLLSPHTYWQDYSLVAIVAMLVTHPGARYLLLLPWPYFYPRNDLLPWVFLALACLAVSAFKWLLPQAWDAECRQPASHEKRGACSRESDLVSTPV